MAKPPAAATEETTEAQEETPAAEETSADALKYHRDRLVAEAHAFFGVSSHVMAGALHLAKVGNKVQFTRDEGQEMLDKFLGHEVAMAGEGA